MKKVLKSILKQIRLLFIWEKSFYGRWADIEIERRKWANDNTVIIVGEKTLRNVGTRKVHQQIIFYTEDNNFTKLLGFRKSPLHYNLSSWH